MSASSTNSFLSYRKDLVIFLNKPINSTDYFSSPFRSDFFIVALVNQGEFLFEVNGTTYCATENCFAITSPYDLKVLTNADNCRVSVLFFTNEFLAASGILRRNAPEMFNYFSARFSPLWKLDDGDANVIKSCFEQLYQRVQHVQAHAYGSEMLRTTFCLFLYEMADLSLRYAHSERARLSRKESIVMQFIALLQQQFQKNRRLKFYASQLNLTPGYLAETIEEVTGRTALDIIDDYVIQEAKTLLLIPQLSISQIAETLNFSDQSFFGKFFKRHSGLSPKAYRLSLT